MYFLFVWLPSLYSKRFDLFNEFYSEKFYARYKVENHPLDMFNGHVLYVCCYFISFSFSFFVVVCFLRSSEIIIIFLP